MVRVQITLQDIYKSNIMAFLKRKKEKKNSLFKKKLVYLLKITFCLTFEKIS